MPGNAHAAERLDQLVAAMNLLFTQAAATLQALREPAAEAQPPSP